MAFLGTGLSASSGLSTYRGVRSDGSWNGGEFEALSSLKAFEETPKIVWKYHEERRRQAQEAQPNAAHEAIAILAQVKGPEVFIAISMDVDGLCARAGHPKAQLLELHDNLSDVKCSKSECDYFVEGFFDHQSDTMARRGFPQCPKCHSDLRPGILLVGEPLRKEAVAAAEAYLGKDEPIDLVLVIGTTAQIWPAAGFVDAAIEKGARVAIINAARGSLISEGGALELTERDWFFVGDPADIVERLLEPLTGYENARV